MGGFDVWFTALELDDTVEGGGGGGMRSVMRGDSVVLAALRRVWTDVASSIDPVAPARKPCRRFVGKSSLCLWLLSASGGGGSSLNDTDLDRGVCCVSVEVGTVAGASADVGDVATSGSEGSGLWCPTDLGREEKKGEPVDAVRNTADRAADVDDLDGVAVDVVVTVLVVPS